MLVQQAYPGEVFFVNNSGVYEDRPGSDSNPGTLRKPFATIDYAIGQCTADRGDVIYVLPGHVETIADADDVDLDVAGVAIIGIGKGSDQPRFDFTATASTLDVGAADCLIENMNFHANVPSVSVGLDLGGSSDGFTLRGCLFDVETTTTDEFTNVIALTGSGDTTIEDNVIDMGLGGAGKGIWLSSTSDRVTIRRNRIVGDYSTGNIVGQTAASTEVYIEDNVLVNGGSGNLNAQPCIEMITGTTGAVYRNHISCNVATVAAATVADTMLFSDNWYNEDAGAAAGGVLRTAATSVTASADD